MSAATEIEPLKGGAGPTKPPTKAESFKKFLWNPDEKAFLGRNAGSWGKIGLFYLIFYSCLAGFFAIMLMLFFESTVSNTIPTQTGANSLIKENPGMGFRPIPEVKSTLIHFKASDSQTYKKYITNMETILHKYHNDSGTYDYAPSCADATDILPCKWDFAAWDTECNQGNDYGYADGQPCVLLKLNKIFDWEPVLFNSSNSDDTDTERYKEMVKGRDAKNPYDDTEEKHIVDTDGGLGVPVICEGENHGDIENIKQVQYLPAEGFRIEGYFPFKNQKGYQAPLVMAKFKNVKKNTLIQMWCKAYASNVEHDKNDRGGSVRFELLVDE